MVYPTYGLDGHSLTPYKEIEVGPLVENNIDNDLLTRKPMMMTSMMIIRTQTGTYLMAKKSCSLMEMSPLRKNQKVNYNLLTQIKSILFLATV